ncbi:RlpA-like double-psi beta-barrel-protein domain-containing protein-containing protein [Trametes elegans]|nr:RlpA-like double-psi beta-barrel-protein domain-containing protein-containing protein [Trametes elegans]
MSPFTYTVFALAIFGSAFAVPAPMAPEVATLDKRITHEGRGTFFNVGLGACGRVNVDSDHIVAISSSIFGDGGNCEQYMEITNTKTHKKAYGLVRDSCPGCGAHDLDLSPSLFQALGASLDEGVIKVSWHFEKKGFHP